MNLHVTQGSLGVWQIQAKGPLLETQKWWDRCNTSCYCFCIWTHHKGLYFFCDRKEWIWKYKVLFLSLPPLKETFFSFLSFSSAQILDPSPLFFSSNMLKATEHPWQKQLWCIMFHDLNNSFLPYTLRTFLRSGNYGIIHYFKHEFFGHCPDHSLFR